MLRATAVIDPGGWPPAEALDSVLLDYDSRHRRRLRMTGEAGTVFLLDLAEARVLGEGDGLLLEDGRIVAVRAAPEPLVEIACATPRDLARVAWHLGNRHCPTQVLDGRLRIREDAVLIGMLERLGATVARVEAPFEPEGGAYGHDAGQSRGNGHG